MKDDGQLPGLCLYVLTRGGNTGTYCTVRAVKGKNTCSSCGRKKGDLGHYADGEDNNDVDSGRAPGKFTGAVPDDDDEVAPLQVVQYGDSTMIYVTEDGTPTLLMVSDKHEGSGEDEDETFTVIGQLSPKNKIMPLNKQGMKRAQLLDLEVNTELLAELQEKGLIEYNGSAAAGGDEAPHDDEEVDTIPGMNVDDKPAPEKSRPSLFPARKSGAKAADTTKPVRPAAKRNVKATVAPLEEPEEE